MKRNMRGFTLVELLVVMAIIAILASIVVPNAIQYIRSARATKAAAEINTIETSLVKMLSDAGRSNLTQLFNPTGMRDVLGVTPGQYISSAQMQRAVDIYTGAFYALLREGRSAITLTDPNTGVAYGTILDPSAIKKLGTSYMAEIGYDPWGSNLYGIYPGPWPSGNGPNIFRRYFSEGDSGSASGKRLPGRGDTPDGLTIGDESNLEFYPDPESDSTESLIFSYPAPRDKVAFIWSYGENLISGQAIYQPGDTPALQYPGDDALYYADQDDPTKKGGGDDVNNWDSAGTWSRFY